MVKYCLTLVIFFSLAACYEEIDLPIPRGQADTNIVIQGDFIKGEIESNIKVYVSRTAGKQSFSELIRVNSVLIENDLGQKISLNEDNDGGYSFKIKNEDVNFSTSIGRQIRLSAIDYDKNLIQSTFQSIVKGPAFEKIQYKVVERIVIGINNIKEAAEFIDVSGSLKKSELQETNYFYNDFEHHYQIVEQIENRPVTNVCYVTEKIKQPLQQFNANEINAEGALNFPILSTKSNNSYAEDSYLTIAVNVMNEGAYNYRSILSNLTEKDNSIFTTAKDKVKSNLAIVGKPDSEVYGYFTVTNQAISRIKLLAKDFKKIKKDCPSELDEIGGCVRRQCCNCLIVKGSSFEKPHFWN
jgi:hypothetical protein